MSEGKKKVSAFNPKLCQQDQMQPDETMSINNADL